MMENTQHWNILTQVFCANENINKNCHVYNQKNKQENLMAGNLEHCPLFLLRNYVICYDPDT